MGRARKDDNNVSTLIAVSNADGSTPITLFADPTTHRLLTSPDIVIESPTGDIDDSNVTFTFTAQPALIVINGSVYRVDKGWSFSGTTATLDGAVGKNGDIFGIM